MTEPKPTKLPLRQRLNQLMLEYGQVAVWTYFAIFAIVLLVFAGAIKLGFHQTGTAAGTVGVWGAAYIATKLTQPIRIAATLALSPLFMKLARLRKRPACPD
ncbi:MAG TPA: hypothetical protein VKP30_16935 [Polyangiaceae bacterium]|nr:hypothetical protein [Polyangiaceae bacterium]